MHADILLGGDASHHQDLYLPIPTSPSNSNSNSPSNSPFNSPTKDPRSPIPVIHGQPQLATDPPMATYTIGQLTRMSAEEDIMVILAHEGEVEGVVQFWPGDLGGWKEMGWKGRKEAGVEERARARARAREREASSG